LTDAPTTNASLVLRLRNRDDEAAWCEFVQIYEPLIYGLIRHKGFQHADAAELTQDVLLAIVSNVGRWQPGREWGSFRGWLFTITRRLMINFLACPARRFTGSGRTSVLQRLLAQPARAEGESHVFDLELKRRLFAWAADRVKERVEPATWEAFWQTAVEDRPVEVIARELGLSVGAIYVARSRVMRQLRIAVEQQSKMSDGEGGHDG